MAAFGEVEAARGSRIVSVRPVLLSHTYDRQDVQGWSGGELAGITAGLVEIKTNEGITGIGETYAGCFAPEVVRAVIEFHAEGLIGEDPSRIQILLQRCRSRMLYWGRSGIAIAAISAIEAALWDLCGKLADKPVVDLLGGARHESLPRYASGGMGSDIDRLQAEAADIRASSYRALKIRTGVSPDADRTKALAARESLSPDAGLAVDAVQGSNPNPWDAAQAIAAGQQLQDLDLLWFEEPCAAWDVKGYAACRRELAMPIAGGESCTTLDEVAGFLAADAIDILQPDASWLGGLLPTLQAAEMARSAGVDVAVHAWGSGGSVMANYHAAFAMPNCIWLEYPSQPNPLIEGLMAEPLRIRDGLVQRPTAAGLGLLLTPELEEAFPYRPSHRYHFEERR